MPHEMSRRDLLKHALIASTIAPAIPCISRRAHAAAPEPLDPTSPPAKAFAFVTDAAEVDTAAHRTFTPGQRCANCSQYSGAPTDASAGCAIFGGKLVPGAGWCKVWTARPG
jgi:hypothetical protein